MISSQERGLILQKYLRYYCGFFVKDNLYSLLDGRSFDDILPFLNTLEAILDNKYNKDELEDFLTDIVQHMNFYEVELQSLFHETHTKCEDLDSNSQLSLALPNSFFDGSERKGILLAFFDAYNFANQHYKKEIIDSPLVEFNNFLSHALRTCVQDSVIRNSERAYAHLYRSTLDIYKDFIVKFEDIINGDKTLVNQLIKIRHKEMGLIGQHETDTNKLETIEQYINFIKLIKEKYPPDLSNSFYEYTDR